MKYYSLLKTQAVGGVSNIPTDILLAPYSALASEIISKPKIFKDGHMRKKFGTVGELMESGYSGIYSILSQYIVSRDERSEAMTCIEEALASIGLKFYDSDFSVGDVRIQRLNLSERIQSLLKTSRNPIRNIDDLVIYGWPCISKRSDVSLYRFNKEIKSALEKYGMRMEGSGTTIDRSKQFPLDRFYVFLNDEEKAAIDNRRELQEGSKKAKKSPEELRNLPYEDVSEMSVLNFNLNKNDVATLDSEGIETIGDLVKKGYKLIDSVSSTMYQKLKQMLAEIGLRFEGSHYPIENGKALYLRPYSIYLNEYAYPAFDFQSASEEEKERFLQTRISRMGLTSKVSAFIPKTLRTVEELIDAIKGKKFALSDLNERRFETIFKVYNIDIFNRPKQVSKLDKERILNVNVQNMTEEEKQKFFDMSLYDLGLTREFSDLFKEKFNIETVKEFVDYPNVVMRNQLSRPDYNTIISLMKSYGVKINFSRPSVNYYANYAPKKFDTSTEEGMQELLNSNLISIGMNPRTINTLGQKFHVTWVRDLIDVERRDLYSSLHYQTAKNIEKLLGKYGLKVKNSYGLPLERSSAKRKENLEKFKTALRSAYVFKIPGLEAPTFQNLTEEDKQKVLSTKLRDIGLSNMLSDRLEEKGIITIADAVSMTKSRFADITNDSAMAKLEKLITPFDIHFSKIKAERVSHKPKVPKPPKPVKVEKKAAVKPVKVKTNIRPCDSYDLSKFAGKTKETMTEEERNEFENLDIEVFCLSELMVNNYHAQGVYKIKDLLLKRYYAIIGNGLSQHAAEVGRQFLKTYNYSFTKFKSGGHKFENIELKTDFASKFKNKTLENMTDQEKEEFLSSSIDCLTISPTAVKTLHDIGINTIEDLTQTRKKILLQAGIESFNILAIKKKLWAYGATLFPPRPISIEVDLSGKTREEVLGMTFFEAGASDSITDSFLSRNIRTFADLKDVDNAHLWDFMRKRENVDFVLNIVKEFGIPMKNMRFIKPKDEYAQLVEKYNGKSIASMTQQEKDEFLSIPIENLGFVAETCDRLARIGVEKVQDLVEKRYTDIKRVTSWEVAVKLKNFIAVVGLKLRDGRMETNSNTPVYELSDETREMCADFINEGVSPKTLNRLIECGIYEPKDAVGKLKSELFNIITRNQCEFEKVMRALDKKGIVCETRGKFYDSTATWDQSDIRSLIRDGAKEVAIQNLYSRGITTIDELIKYTKNNIRHYIKKSVESISDALEKRGLEFSKKPQYFAQQTGFALLDELKSRGIEALKELDASDFESGTMSRTEIDEAVSLYFVWKLQNQVFSKQTEELLNAALSKIADEKKEINEYISSMEKANLSGGGGKKGDDDKKHHRDFNGLKEVKFLFDDDKDL